MKGHMNQRQWIPIEDQTELNSRRVQMIPVAVTVLGSFVFLVLGLIVGMPVVGLVLGALVVGAFMMKVHRSAEEVVLKMVGGLPASEHEHARLFNIIDGLCVVGGDQRPALRVVGIEYPVALAVAMPGQPGTIVVSAGFLRSMGRVELEAVMAHLMWRLRSGDIGMSTYLIALGAAVQRFGASRLIRGLVSRFSDERILLWADVAACQATRYPPALVSALEIVERANEVPVGRIGAQALWFATPDSPGDGAIQLGEVPNIGFAHPSLTDRISVLKEI